MKLSDIEINIIKELRKLSNEELECMAIITQEIEFCPKCESIQEIELIETQKQTRNQPSNHTAFCKQCNEEL